MGASLSMTNYPTKGRGAFRFLGSCSIFEIGQARHVKIGVQINHGEYHTSFFLFTEIGSNKFKYI